MRLMKKTENETSSGVLGMIDGVKKEGVCMF